MEKFGKTPNFSGKHPFYSSFQNPSENSVIHYSRLLLLELACLKHQVSLELVRRSQQFAYTFNVEIHPRLEQRWLKLLNSKHGPQSDFFM